MGTLLLAWIKPLNKWLSDRRHNKFKNHTAWNQFYTYGMFY